MEKGERQGFLEAVHRSDRRFLLELGDKAHLQ